MEKYIGMDVHGDSCTVFSVNRSGKRVRQDVVETNGQALLEYVRQIPACHTHQGALLCV